MKQGQPHHHRFSRLQLGGRLEIPGQRNFVEVAPLGQLGSARGATGVIEGRNIVRLDFTLEGQTVRRHTSRPSLRNRQCLRPRPKAPSRGSPFFNEGISFADRFHFGPDIGTPPGTSPKATSTFVPAAWQISLMVSASSMGLIGLAIPTVSEPHNTKWGLGQIGQQVGHHILGTHPKVGKAYWPFGESWR